MPSKLTTPFGLIVLFISVCGLRPGMTWAVSHRLEKQTQQEFIEEIRKNFEQEKFEALDLAALEARESKERFPGAEWKLHVFYQTLTWPTSGSDTVQAWMVHLKQLQKWADKAAEVVAQPGETSERL